ncbi:T9SS type A sorting domain-containing protein [bacterium]|nr:T9SS type A sorting domain-containing protein [bacterium]
MKISRFFLLAGVISAFLFFGAVGTAFCEVAESGRVTLNCGTHTIDVTYVAFTYDGTVVYEDLAPGLSCVPGGGGSNLYDFGTPGLNINDFECDYTCDGGPSTHVVVPAGTFYFHMPFALECPSPGGTIYPEPGNPGADDGFLIVSHHDMLMMGESECFEFKGGFFDYVCVLWYCEGPFEPIFHITPGCDSPCGDPTCTPAVYTDVAWAPACNPLPNVWCRVFYPVGLTQPGCWCYFFEYQLPVELQSFEAVPMTGAVRLNWTTASEQDNAYFILERSSQGGLWTEIAREDGQGNSATATNYTYLDEGLHSGTEYTYRLKSVDLAGAVEELSVAAAVPLSDVVPEGYSLAQNYPNPFNAVTELSYAIANAGHVRLAIYNVTGRLVATLVNEEQGAGEYQVTFDAGDLPSGVYIYRLEAGTFVSQHKMVLLK